MSDEKLVLAGEILDILHDVWPKPSHATVHLESHQWIRLRRILLDTIGELVEERPVQPSNPVGLPGPEDTVVIPAIREGHPSLSTRRTPPWLRPSDEVFREDIEKTISGLHGKSPRFPRADGRSVD
jgi:hypothetical protein